MLITSFNFLLFVAGLLIVYFFVVSKKFQWLILLFASYAFYAFAGIKLFVYLLFTTSTVFGSALLLDKIGDTPKKRKLYGKRIIIIAAVCNFGILAFFKWYNAFAGTGNRIIDALTNSTMRIPSYSLLLPLGISFYTFQAVGYLIDVYRGQVKPERNFFKFSLFVSFFPQLIMGPISRHSELAEQLYASRKFDYVEFRRGFQLVIWGLFLKLVIADRLVLASNTIFSNPEKYNGLFVMIGLAINAIRTYTDFSGGVNIARGVAQMLGINMPQNFQRPFFAESLPDYWRRWHMTLNAWWRDYVFYPLVLSKPLTKISKFTRKYISPKLGKVIGVYICIMLVRVINAMWHGADLYYVASGFYHGTLITLGLICEPFLVRLVGMLRIKTDCFSWKLFRIIRTFALVCFGRVFLVSGSVRSSIATMKNMISDFNPWVVLDIIYTLPKWDLNVVLIALSILFIVELLQESGIAIRQMLEKQNIVFQWIILLGGIFFVLIFGMYGYGYNLNAFIYQGF